MLNKIEIKNFKSIVRERIEFGRVNIFIGCNGAGKSNILEAIGMLSTMLSGEIQYERLMARGVRLSTPDVFKSALKSQGKRKPIFTLSATFDGLTYAASIRAHAENSGASPFEFQAEKLWHGRKRLGGISPRSRTFQTSQPSTLSVIQNLEATGKLNDELRAAISSVRDYAIFAPSTPILRGVSPDESKKSPLGLYGGGLERGFNSLFKAENRNTVTVEEFFVFFDWVRSISVKAPSPKIQSSHIHTPSRVVSFEDKYMTSAFKNLYAYDVSEGALYVFFVLLLLCLEDTPPIFALDNVDSSLNPGMVRKLVNKIVEYTAKNKRQIFMTSHNPTALDAMDIFDDEQRVFIVRRDKVTGETKVDRLTPPKGMTKEEWAEKFSGMKLSNLWLDGMLEGALPDGF